MTPRHPSTARCVRRSRPRTAGAVLVLALALATTSACTIEVVDRRADPASPTSSTTSTREPSSTPPPEAEDEEPQSPDTPTTTVSCTDGTLVLDRAGVAAALDEDCAHVTIAAADVHLTAASVTTLEIVAAGAVVHTRSLETLTVDGAGCTVVWETGSPTIEDSGAGNVLVEQAP